MLLQHLQNEVGLCIHCNITSYSYLETLDEPSKMPTVYMIYTLVIVRIPWLKIYEFESACIPHENLLK